MLEDYEIQENKEVFCNILWDLDVANGGREGTDVTGLINYLDDNGFFTAPASTKYHCSFPGGLCLHSLNVYRALVSLCDRFISDDKYSKSSLIIVGLLHDLNKINFYEETVKNEKVYSNYGKKYDELGNFDWVATKSYKVKDAKDRKILGNKGTVSYLIASQFIPLTNEETMALMYQYSAVDREPVNDLSEILAKFNLCVLLHSADIIATYCIEKND